MRFGFEQLENRLLLAASVTQKGATLTIKFDAQGAADVLVAGTGEGAVTVTGVTDGGDFTGVKNIKILGADGTDEIILQGVSISGDVKADLKGGDDILAVIGATNIGGNLSVKTGAGNDAVALNGDATGDTINVGKNVTVDLGTATTSDTFAIFGNTAGEETTIAGNLSVKGKDGTQNVSLDLLTLGRSLKVDLGNGNDSVGIGTQMNAAGLKVNIAGDVGIKVGAGDDTVTLLNSNAGQVTIGKKLSVDLGHADAGVDVFTATANAVVETDEVITIAGKASIKGGNGAQDVNIDGVTFGSDLSIKLGNDNDTADIGQLNGTIAVDVEGGLAIDMGAGDDQLRLERLTIAKKSKLSGGKGTDMLTETVADSVESAAALKVSDFEVENIT